MKKIVSLLLAGLMGLTMAASAMAGNVISGFQQPALEAIFGEYFLGSYVNGTLIYPDGTILYPNGNVIRPVDPVDPGFSVTPGADSKYWYGTAVCPTDKCDKVCDVYLLPDSYTSYPYYTSTPYAYCKSHGFQTVAFKDVTLPSDTAEYTITTTAYIGGEVLVNDASVIGYRTVKKGETVEVRIVPEYGYVIAAVYLNGYSIGDTECFQLNGISRDYNIRAIFKKIDVNRPYTITASAEGEGNIYAVVNDKSVGAISSLTGTYADQITLRFTPVSDHYSVESVVINGVNQGSISYYTVGRMLSDMTVSATFKWNCPFSDIDKAHMDAVEYVSEINVMGSPNKYFNTDKFMGKSGVTLRAMACYLAELADVDGKLSTAAQRVEWAIEKGLLTKDEKQNVNVTWTRAGDMLNAYVRLLEKESEVVFKALENVTDSYEIAKAMGLVTEVAYKADSAITRYDMAEICYAVAQLEVK